MVAFSYSHGGEMKLVCVVVMVATVIAGASVIIMMSSNVIWCNLTGGLV